MTETPRQRYLRNHEENMRIMRAAVVREREAGNEGNAKLIEEIVSQWETVGEIAALEESEEMP